MKNIFLLEKSDGNIPEDIISFDNNHDIIIISIYFSEIRKDREIKFVHNLHSSF